LHYALAIVLQHVGQTVTEGVVGRIPQRDQPSNIGVVSAYIGGPARSAFNQNPTCEAGEIEKRIKNLLAASLSAGGNVIRCTRLASCGDQPYCRGCVADVDKVAGRVERAY
jgi:hypothetical protein